VIVFSRQEQITQEVIHQRRLVRVNQCGRPQMGRFGHKQDVYKRKICKSETKNILLSEDNPPPLDRIAHKVRYGNILVYLLTRYNYDVQLWQGGGGVFKTDDVRQGGGGGGSIRSVFGRTSLMDDPLTMIFCNYSQQRTASDIHGLLKFIFVTKLQICQLYIISLSQITLNSHA